VVGSAVVGSAVVGSAVVGSRLEGVQFEEQLREHLATGRSDAAAGTTLAAPAPAPAALVTGGLVAPVTAPPEERLQFIKQQDARGVCARALEELRDGALRTAQLGHE
jgi:hypothetical protein